MPGLGLGVLDFVIINFVSMTSYNVDSREGWRHH